MKTADLAANIFCRAVGTEDVMAAFSEKMARDGPRSATDSVRGIAVMSFVMADIFADVAKTRDQAGGGTDAPQTDKP